MSDGELASKWRASPAVRVTNTAPLVGSVAVTPGQPKVGDTLTCGATGVRDADGDEVRLAYRWMADGVTISSTGPRLSSGFRKEQSIQCGVTASDGQLTSAMVSSNALTVRNSPPLLNKVLFAPARATTEDALRCQVVGASDPDGDQVRIRWNWYEGEAPLAVEGPVLAAEYTKRDHTYQCRATPSDGTLNGEAMTAEGEVQNAAPQIVKASILPRLPTTVDGLTCEANGVSDADGDPLTMTYRWTVNGVDSDIKASALPATVTRAGDTVICAIQADDKLSSVKLYRCFGDSCAEYATFRRIGSHFTAKRDTSNKPKMRAEDRGRSG